MCNMCKLTLMYIMYVDTYVIHHEYEEAGARRPGRTVYICGAAATPVASYQNRTGIPLF